MKHLITILLLATSGFAFSNVASIHKEAEGIIGETALEIDVTFDNNLVTLNCPSGAAGCFRSYNGGEILQRTDLPMSYVDVVTFGLISDYIQYTNTRTIDPIRTCEAQTQFLKKQKRLVVAEKYHRYCDNLKDNLLALR